MDVMKYMIITEKNNKAIDTRICAIINLILRVLFTYYYNNLLLSAEIMHLL